MTQSMHDLRVALRESSKKLEDTEQLVTKQRNEFEQQLRKKDDVISMKELIIKEKDAYIIKLEEEISKHDPTFISATDFNIGTDIVASPRASFLDVASPKPRTKRTAISAESAQQKKSKDLRVVLQAFNKSER